MAYFRPFLLTFVKFYAKIDRYSDLSARRGQAVTERMASASPDGHINNLE